MVQLCSFMSNKAIKYYIVPKFITPTFQSTVSWNIKYKTSDQNSRSLLQLIACYPILGINDHYIANRGICISPCVTQISFGDANWTIIDLQTRSFRYIGCCITTHNSCYNNSVFDFHTFVLRHITYAIY